MEEDSGDSELLQGYQWLLRDLPRLPLFDSVRATTAVALQQVSRRPGKQEGPGLLGTKTSSQQARRSPRLSLPAVQPVPPLCRPSTWRRNHRPSALI